MPHEIQGVGPKLGDAGFVLVLFKTPLGTPFYTKGDGIGKWYIDDPGYVGRRRTLFGQHDHGGARASSQKKSGLHKGLLKTVGIHRQCNGLCVVIADL